MNINADNFFFARYNRCPRKTVFDYNRNTFQSKRLLKSPSTLEEFSQELYENTIVALIQKKKSGIPINQKLISDVFFAVYKVIKGKKFSKYSEDIIEKYDSGLEKVLESIFFSIEKNFLGLTEIFKGKYETKILINIDLKQLVEDFLWKNILQGTYSMSLKIPIVYKRDNDFYIKFFSFDEGEISENNPLISLFFIIFKQLGLKLKAVEIFKPFEKTKKEIVSPGFLETDFIFYLKSILHSIEDQHILKNHRIDNCFYCNHKSLCANPGLLYKRKVFFQNKKKPKVFYFDKRAYSRGKEEFFKK